MFDGGWRTCWGRPFSPHVSEGSADVQKLRAGFLTPLCHKLSVFAAVVLHAGPSSPHFSQMLKQRNAFGNPSVFADTTAGGRFHIGRKAQKQFVADFCFTFRKSKPTKGQSE